MQIDSLKYFYDVATLKSISKVASQSHISQPALSQQLLKLEKKLGVKLLERSNKGVELTPQGAILLKYSEEILKSYDDLLKELGDVQGKMDINIQSNNIAANFFISKIMPNIINNFKGYQLSFTQDQSKSSQVNLLHNRTDVIIGDKFIEDDMITSEYVGSDEIILVSRAQYKPTSLENAKLLLLQDNIFDISKIKDKIKASEVVFKSDSITTLKNYLMKSNTIAVLPKCVVKEELEVGIIKELKLFEEYVYYHIYVNYRKDIDKNIKSKIKKLKAELEKS